MNEPRLLPQLKSHDLSQQRNRNAEAMKMVLDVAKESSD